MVNTTGRASIRAINISSQGSTNFGHTSMTDAMSEKDEKLFKKTDRPSTFKLE
jgi:hypothetical protein